MSPTLAAAATALMLACAPARCEGLGPLGDTIGFLYASYSTGKLCAERIGTFTEEEIALAAAAIAKYISSSRIEEAQLVAIKDNAAAATRQLVARLPAGDSPVLRAACQQASGILAVLITEQRMANKLEPQGR